MVTINTNQTNSALNLLNSGSTSSASNSQPAITVTGLGSSFDTGAIVNSLIEIERIPIFSIQSKQEVLLEKIKATTELEQHLTDLQVIVSKLRTADDFNTKAASFYNDDTTARDVATVSVDSTVQTGNHELVVNTLASNSRHVSDTGYESQYTALDGAGTYTIALAGGSSAAVTFTADDSLTSIANKINAADAGVTASIINDGSADPYKLIVTSDDTGDDNEITFTGVGDPDLPFSFTSLQTAVNAEFTIDSVSFTKASNYITDAMEGVTLDLNTTGSGSINIDSDAAAVKSNIQEFVDQYNVLVGFIDENTTYSSGWAPGPLFGDSVIKSVQSAMRNIISAEVPGSFSDYKSLSSIGIKSNNAGELEIDDGELTTAFDTDPTGAMNVFVATGESSDTSNLDYTSHNTNTVGGEYEVNVDADGVVTMRKSGATTWNATDSSVTNYHVGQSGNDEDGLIVYLVPGQSDFTATVNASRGVFDNLTSSLSNLLNDSTGAVALRTGGLTEQVTDYDDDIRNIEDRVASKADQIRAKFAALEGLLSQFESEKSFLTSQFAGMSKK